MPDIRVPVDRFGRPDGDGSWMIARYGLTVYAFDPTPNALIWLANNPFP